MTLDILKYGGSSPDTVHMLAQECSPTAEREKTPSTRWHISHSSAIGTFSRMSVSYREDGEIMSHVIWYLSVDDNAKDLPLHPNELCTLLLDTSMQL